MADKVLQRSYTKRGQHLYAWVPGIIPKDVKPMYDIIADLDEGFLCVMHWPTSPRPHMRETVYIERQIVREK